MYDFLYRLLEVSGHQVKLYKFTKAFSKIQVKTLIYLAFFSKSLKNFGHWPGFRTNFLAKMSSNDGPLYPTQGLDFILDNS